MQSCAAVNNKITEELVYSLAAVAKPKEIKEILETAIKGDFKKARDGLLDLMLKYGLSGLDVIKQIQSQTWALDIDNNKKIELIDKCGEIEFRLTEGSDEFIQLEALLANYCVK
jgi:replication factor C small subunit